NWASRVRAAEIVADATYNVRASGNEDEIDAYVVSTTIKPPPTAVPVRSSVMFEYEPPDPGALDVRPETLVLKRESLKVHHVRKISVDADVLPIRRYSHTHGADDVPF